MSADSPARQRILDAAFRLFYARGIRAVGVDTIIAESGVAKATFYKHFPAKDDLVVAYLDRVDGIWFGQLRAAGRGGRRRRRPTSWSASSTRSRPRAGARATAAARSSTPPPRASRAPRSTTAPWRTRTGCWPGSPGSAPTAGARDPAQLARTLTLLLDGGLASGALDASPEAPGAARAAAQALVSQAVGERSIA